MAKELQFVLLLDCYGDLLTDHQRNVMELYYCEDLSLAEIARTAGISRQGIRHLIKKGEESSITSCGIKTYPQLIFSFLSNSTLLSFCLRFQTVQL